MKSCHNVQHQAIALLSAFSIKELIGLLIGTNLLFLAYREDAQATHVTKTLG